MPFKNLIVVYQLYCFDMAFFCRQEIRQDYAEDFVKLLFQSAFTCSKLTIETLEHGVKYVQS